MQLLLLAFAIYDSAVGSYNKPFFAPSIEAALRDFRLAVQDPKTGLQRSPGDYTLFHIGEYNAENGKMTSLQTPHSLGVAIEFLGQDAAMDYADKLTQGSHPPLNLEEVVNG
jgi:hypothetical protein